MKNYVLIPDPCKPFGVNQTIYQGSGCIQKIPEILELEGWGRVMLVVDPGVQAAGGIKPFEELLAQNGYDYCIFSDITPNPLASNIEEIGIPMYKNFKADVMIAIGGGSTMDSAKGIAIVGESDQTVKQASGDIVSTNPFVPLAWKTFPIIAVPTTCGTGSEVIRNAVISEPNGHKMVPMHDCIIPNYAVCDPDLLATQPPHVAAAAGMDALVQAIEAYVSLGACDFSEVMSLRAVELIGPAIVPYYHNRSILKYADAMSKGCMYGGLAWNNSFVAQIHGSNHPITEILHIPHGDACAILLPPFVEWNGVVCREKFWKVHNLMYPDHPIAKQDFEASMLVEKLIKLNRDLNILGGKTMADYGCTEEIIDRIIADFNANVYTFPRTTSKAQMKQMFMDVMNGVYT